HAMPAFASLTVTVRAVLDKARLRAWLKALPRTILRAKGIVRVADADGAIATRAVKPSSSSDENRMRRATATA
ncbi:GTP-binding protein, partial [Burkholderia cenocepacia]